MQLNTRGRFVQVAILCWRSRRKGTKVKFVEWRFLIHEYILIHIGHMQRRQVILLIKKLVFARFSLPFFQWRCDPSVSLRSSLPFQHCRLDLIRIGQMWFKNSECLHESLFISRLDREKCLASIKKLKNKVQFK